MNWVSVKKSLPEYDSNTSDLKYSKNLLIYDGEKIDIGVFIDDKFTSIGIFSGGDMKEICHWIEIPDPPAMITTESTGGI